MTGYNSIVISSGHGLKVRGASGIIDEVDEARKVVDALGGGTDRLWRRGHRLPRRHVDVAEREFVDDNGLP